MMEINGIYEGIGRGLYGMADVLSFLERGLEFDKGVIALLKAGLPVIQLRWKNANAGEFLTAAKRFSMLCRQYGAKSIVNDRLDIALAAGVDGVHLGQDDLPVEEARSMLPKNAIIGLSTHNLKQVEEALSRPVDYIGFGPVFSTSTKKNADPIVGERGLRAAVELVNGAFPVVAIGGVGRDNVHLISDARADLVAIVADLLVDEDLERRARSIHQEFIRALRG